MKHLLLTTIAAVVLVGSVLADPIHDAAWGGDLAGVQAELDKGTDVNAKDALGTPLHYGARYGHWQVIEFLIHKGADVNAEKAGVTPLHWASRGNYMQIAKLLIAEDADVNAKSDLGETSLDWANRYTQGSTADLLRKHGGRSGSIHGAARDGDIEAVKDFLASGTDVNEKDKNGRTALHLAANKQIAEFLVSNRADVNATSNSGSTPLHYAADLGHKEIVKLLIANDADVSAKTKWGQPPMQNAASSGHKEIVELLIAKGADVNDADDGGWTPLHEAVDRGHKEIAELLIAEDADVNAKDDKGRTPLDRAVGYTEIVDLLRKHGGKTAEELKALMPRLEYGKDKLTINVPFDFRFFAKAGKGYTVEATGDLLKWNKVETIRGTGSEVKFTDTREAVFEMQYYRVKLVD